MPIKLKIEIDQNKPGLITSSVRYEIFTTSINYNPKHLNQIGTFPDCVKGYTAYFEPSGLSINPFIKEGDISEIEGFKKRINNFIENEGENRYEKVLTIEEIDAIQIIKLSKL